MKSRFRADPYEDYMAVSRSWGSFKDVGSLLGWQV